jgi:hypothetical protein
LLQIRWNFAAANLKFINLYHNITNLAASLEVRYLLQMRRSTHLESCRSLLLTSDAGLKALLLLALLLALLLVRWPWLLLLLPLLLLSPTRQQERCREQQHHPLQAAPLLVLLVLFGCGRLYWSCGAVHFGSEVWCCLLQATRAPLPSASRVSRGIRLADVKAIDGWSTNWDTPTSQPPTDVW